MKIDLVFKRDEYRIVGDYTNRVIERKKVETDADYEQRAIAEFDSYVRFCASFQAGFKDKIIKTAHI